MHHYLLKLTCTLLTDVQDSSFLLELFWDLPWIRHCLPHCPCSWSALCGFFKIEVCFLFLFFFLASYLVLAWDWENENPWGTLEASAAQTAGAWRALSCLFSCPFKMSFSTFKIKSTLKDTHSPLLPVCSAKDRHCSVSFSSQLPVKFGKNLIASLPLLSEELLFF